MKLFIACSSKNEIPEKYKKSCERFLMSIFEMENDLVFGAYNEGIMGIAYQECLKRGRKIIGVCPKIYESDFENLKCDKEIITNNVGERVNRLIEESDAIIILPGGIGTIHELFTAIESKRCHEFDKPIILYNSCGYFTKLLLFLEDVYKENFTPINIRESYHIAFSAKDAMDYIESYYKKDIKKRIKEKE